MYICRVEDRIGNGYIPGSRDDIASYFFLEKQGFHARGVTDGPSGRLRAGHGSALPSSRERVAAGRIRRSRGGDCSGTGPRRGHGNPVFRKKYDAISSRLPGI